MNVFEAVEAQARRVRNLPALLEASDLKRKMLAVEDDIKQYRATREHMRKFCFLRADTNGTFLTGPMHELEVSACEKLCPLLRTADWKAKKEAWLWVLRQPWGQEFRAPGFEQKRWTTAA